jgi:hypothetical protein
MKPIDISINKARILSFTVTLKDDKPEVSATIGLYSPNDTRIAEYSLATNHWNANLKLDLPFDLVPPIKEIAAVLERIVALHCQGSMLQLPGKSSAVVIE